MNTSPTRAPLSLVKETSQTYSIPGTTMSTVEIAELTGKRHDNVLRDTQKMLTELYGENDLLRFEEIYHDGKNREYSCYRLPKKEVLVLVSGYSIKLRMKIITRLEELETQKIDPVAAVLAMNKSQVLMLAAEQAKKIEEMQPKVDAFERLDFAEGDHCITDSAKVLKVRPKDLFGMLSERRWIYRRQGGKGWVGYQDKIQQGVLTHRITTVIDSHTGMEKVREQVLVTPKGLARLAMILEGGLS